MSVILQKKLGHWRIRPQFAQRPPLHLLQMGFVKLKCGSWKTGEEKEAGEQRRWTDGDSHCLAVWRVRLHFYAAVGTFDSFNCVHDLSPEKSPNPQTSVFSVVGRMDPAAPQQLHTQWFTFTK